MSLKTSAFIALIPPLVSGGHRRANGSLEEVLMP